MRFQRKSLVIRSTPSTWGIPWLVPVPVFHHMEHLAGAWDFLVCASLGWGLADLAVPRPYLALA